MNALVTLSDEQTRAIEFVVSELMNPSGLKELYGGRRGSSRRRAIVALSGPAGSGKTTTIKQLVEKLSEQTPVMISAMTNKAALVLRQKGLDALTVHQACMRPMFKPPLNTLAQFLEGACNPEFSGPAEPPRGLIEKYGEFALKAAIDTTAKFGICAALRELGIRDMFKYLDRWLPKEQADGVLIVDEASMLSENDFKTIASVFSKILLVGDEYQLPPVDPKNQDAKGVFWTVEKRFALTEIHRQCADSQPLRLATEIRTGEPITYEDTILPVDIERAAAGVPVIVWRNKTRINITNQIREKLGYGEKPPQPGEYLVCRNGADRAAKNRGLINNTIWKVVESDGFKCVLESDDGQITLEEYVHIEELDKGFGISFRFAYALTAHNAQGSEWPEVMVHHPDGRAFMSFRADDARKWLYTAVTRAKERVLFVKDMGRTF